MSITAEAEQSVLGAVMLDPEAYDDISGLIRDTDFSHDAHRAMWRAAADLAATGQHADIVTLSSRLRERGELDRAGGMQYIGSLSRSVPSAANVRQYAEIVRRQGLRREAASIASQVSKDVMEADDPVAALDQAQSAMLAIGDRGQGGPARAGDRLGAWMDRLDARYQRGSTITGLPSGYADVDAMTAGLQGGDLIILAARPSMGKTTFALNVAEHAAVRDGKSTAVFSLEMDTESLLDRSAASLSGVPLDHVRRGTLEDGDWPRISRAQELIAPAPLWIDDQAGLSAPEIASRCRRLQRRDGLGLVVIDYLQLMTPPKAESRARELALITGQLKQLAKELDVPVLLLSQLNRALEQRQNKRPMMSDLRESGSLEQDADLIGFLYRDEVYHSPSRTPGVAELIIAKQRQGATGTVPLKWRGEVSRFDSLDPDAKAQFWAAQQEGSGKQQSGGAFDDL